MSEERWVAVSEWEDTYEISDQGRVRRMAPRVDWEGGTRIHAQTKRRVGLAPMRVLKPMIKNGYAVVCLSRGSGTAKWLTVHGLVARAFLPPRPSAAHQINHKDGDKANNHAANLEWMTARGQQRHAHETGLSNHEQFRKLTADQAREVFNTLGRVSNREWAARLGVTMQTISAIRTGRSYRNITGADARSGRYDWFPCDRDCECRCHQRRNRVR